MSLSNKPTQPLNAHSRSDSMLQWRKLFGPEPPRRIGIALLTAMLAQAQQESMIASTMRTLESQLRPSTALPPFGTQSKSKFQIGDRLIRGWGATNHEVTVLARGFLYRSKSYHSLSEIARVITGVRWSGPRFFKTREKGA